MHCAKIHRRHQQQLETENGTKTAKKQKQKAKDEMPRNLRADKSNATEPVAEAAI